MLSELCAEVRNYFLAHKEADIHQGTFVIENGTIGLEGIVIDGQYFRIVGSVLNDGVYQYPTNELLDETFTGAIWAMSVEPDFIALADEIKNWQAKNGDTLNSPYQSESFGGYSYSKAVGSNGGAYSWKDQFKSRLDKWRRISVL